MIEPKPTADEPHRLGALRRLDLLDTEPEERFDRFVRIAKRLFDVPMAAVSLVDEHRAFLKASTGLAGREVPRKASFCSHSILCPELMVVEDTHQDERFHDSPLVVSGPEIGFYAGFPLASSDGHLIGTLCILDHEPRELSDDDRRMLEDLGRMVTDELQEGGRGGVDPLTGLPDAQTFQMVAKSVIANARRSATRVTLALFGLDQLCEINEAHGYDAGDDMLRRFARLLHGTVRDSDVVARVGSGTFAMLLTGCDAGTAAQVIGRVGRRMLHARDEGDLPAGLDYSLGLATLNLGRVDGLDVLMEQAQQQLDWDRQDRAA